MSARFVHLSVHTEFSLVDSIVRIKPLIAAAKEAKMPALAVTDQCNLFGMVKFYKAAVAAGIKPLVGVDLQLVEVDEEYPFSRIQLLCRNHEGYLNLTRLVSRCYQEGQQRGVPMLHREWLEDASDGLIALSGGRQGDVGQALAAGNRAKAEQRLEEWQLLFPGSYYLELQRTGRSGDEEYLHAVVELATLHHVPVVATNDVRFLHSDDFDAHEARVCIQDSRTLDDPHRSHNYSEQQYFRSQEEMEALFADIPEALENSVEIAKRCNLEIELGKNYLPEFPIPDGMTTDEYFRHVSHQGMEKRYKTLLDPAAEDYAARRQPYEDRLKIELDVIVQMGFPGYFLIVADFIHWAKKNQIPVGPGRGSGAGSVVAYALDITDLDPLEYDLLFERFLNPERVSMPDFDVDFCMERRDEVIDYVAQHYGREKVSQIITHGTMAAKAVIRDVGRVLGQPYGFVDRIAKLIPFEVGITLDRALNESDELRQAYDEDEDVKSLFDLAQTLEGLARNAGKHAGGVVIAPSQLTDFAPLYCEEGGGNLVTQYDKDDVEAVGLVKFDFLGLRTLTIIDWALQTINSRRTAAGEEAVDIATIPLDDVLTFKLLKACSTTAVFQLESRGMKDLVKRLQPDSFEDIIALVALFRPGPLQSGMVDNFINRKHGREAVSYPDAQYQHESLKHILEPTYGIILYQEQVMQIAQVLAGYTLGGADMLRRAMGKKKPEEMAKQRSVFESGAADRGIDATLAMKIFDLVEKFAGYGFNKSHSAAYALVSYQTAWLKAHYPAAFMAAVLSSDMDNTDKVVTFIEECREMKLNVVSPDLNHSHYMFTIDPEDRVIYGLGAIKGVGEGAIEGILEERASAGPYRDLFDFCRRIDSRKVNRRVAESLIRAGALDQLGANRATLMANLGKAMQMAEQESRSQDGGMDDLFGLGAPAEEGQVHDVIQYEHHDDWDDDQRLTGEKETLGLYLTGHPITRYEAELVQFVSGRLSDLSVDIPSGDRSGGGYNRRRNNEKRVVIAGLLVAIRVMKSQRGRMGFFTLDDRTARIEVSAFSEVFETYRNLLTKDQLLVVEGSLGFDDYSGGIKVTADKIYSIDQAREMFARRVQVDLTQISVNSEALRALADTMEPFKEGSCPVAVRYLNGNAEACIEFGKEWRIRPSDELLKRMRQRFGDNSVQIIYTNTPV